MVIEIKNLRNEKLTQPWEVRVDRTSVLGNPFKMNNESQRASVCAEYRSYFYGIVNNSWKIMHDYCVTSEEREEFMNELRRLYRLAKKYGKLSLYCWCAPKQCHAETICEFLNKYLKEVQ